MRTRRAAFTLTELLIVLAIIAMLGALLVYVMPSFRERNRASRGGQAVQGWLTYARQQAMYRQTPQGVRFMFAPVTLSAGPTTLGVVECQYLEQPDDYNSVVMGANGQPVSGYLYQGPNNGVVVKGANFADGSVEPGDSLEIFGSGVIHHINSSTPIGPMGGIQQSDPVNFPNVYDMLILDSALPPNSLDRPIVNYRIIRKPRVSGDETMKLPNSVLINLNLTFTASPTGYLQYGGYYPSTLRFTDAPLNTQGYFDVMFGPSGAVLETAGSKLILWVHTQEAATPFDSNPTLIVVYTASGAVAAYNPVPPPALNPYALIR
jgi:prepilin-type N-terminal cleavage/methylation domain-containing protein